jgi:predicted negative regulator of RcsB-dependent stress response
MNKKLIIITLSSVLVASYVGFFIYQRVQRKKSDEALDSYEDALKKLQDLKGGESKPDLSALTDSFGQPKILTF